tara:strand:- start:368 stop:619 length:252 start_codon:yes stop_codon:yes gene_type:complete
MIIQNEDQKALLKQSVQEQLDKEKTNATEVAFALVEDRQENGKEYWLEALEDSVTNYRQLETLLAKIEDYKITKSEPFTEEDL